MIMFLAVLYIKFIITSLYLYLIYINKGIQNN